jgi:hypothetical protein
MVTRNTNGNHGSRRQRQRCINGLWCSLDSDDLILIDSNLCVTRLGQQVILIYFFSSSSVSKIKSLLLETRTYKRCGAWEK